MLNILSTHLRVIPVQRFARMEMNSEASTGEETLRRCSLFRREYMRSIL